MPTTVLGAQLVGSVSTPGPSADLTTLGSTDWIHWGLGSASALNRKAGGGARISDFSMIGGRVARDFSSPNRVTFTWSDGTPVASTSTSAGVWVGGTGNGFEFTVPADTSVQSLDVYLGGYQSRGRVQAFLSDGSAPAFDTTVQDLGGEYDRRVTLGFQAGSAGQTLTVRYTRDGSSGNVTLQAATLEGGGGGGNSAPVLAPIGNRSVTAGQTLNFAVSASDGDGPAPLVLAASPLPGSAQFTDNGGGSGSFSWTPGSGDVAGSPYSITVTATDGGGLSDSETIQVTVNAAGGGSGSLGGSVATPTGTANLTSLGSADWRHWGLSSSTSVNRKAGVSSQIGGLSVIGGSASRFNAAARLTYAWSDGTPTGSASTNAGLYIGSNGSGFEFTVPADTTARRLVVFLGGYKSRGRIQAFLSDGSAPAFDTTVENLSSPYDRRVTLDYSAAGAGQSLTLRYTQVTGSNVTLQAATLEGGGGGGGGGGGIALPFSDNFGDGNADGWSFVDETPTPGSWTVTGGELRQQAVVESVQSFEESYHLGSYAWLIGGGGLSDYRLSAKLRRVGSGRPESLGLLFRYVDADNFYRITLNPRYGFARLEKRSSGVFFTLAVSAIGYDPSAAFVLTADVRGADLRISLDGQPLLAARDGSFPSGSVGLFAQALAGFDDVQIVAADAGPSVRLAKPTRLAVLSGNDLAVEALARGVPAGGGVELSVPGRSPVLDTSAPYTANFNNLPSGERTVTARILNSGGSELARDEASIAVSGEVYLALGDSITNGIGDFFEGDNDDARRIFATQAYAATLAAHLEALPPAELIVFNEGIGGDSADRTDQQRLQSLLERHPEANVALIQLGTNDALRNPPRPSGLACGANDNACLAGTFRGDLQSVVDRLADAGVTAWLATAPPALVDADPLNSATNDRIAEYNEVVRTKITGAAAGPDFWTLFGVDEDGNGTLERVRRDLYGDSLHPTGLGHALMAAEWFNELAGDAAGTPLDPFFIDAISRNAYRQDLLAAGDRYLVDSAATVAALPGSLSAARWILPRQADAGATGASFLSFTLDRAATVHVAYDADASSLPGWLSGFGDTGLAVTTSATTYRVYARAYAPGVVTLGGNAAPGAAGAGDMYLVGVLP